MFNQLNQHSETFWGKYVDFIWRLKLIFDCIKNYIYRYVENIIIVIPIEVPSCNNMYH